MEAIYNYLLPTYMPRTDMRRNVHGKSELREHYDNIIRLTKSTPIYMIKLSNQKQSFALGVKEMAMDLQSSLKELNANGNDLFERQKVYSGDEKAVSAKMIEGKEELLPNSFTIKVRSLARSQVNTGKSLYATGRGPQKGDYYFQVKVDNDTYEFKFPLNEDMTNLDVVNKLENFINEADVGIQATHVRTHEDEMIHMVLESYKTGEEGGLIFELSDVGAGKRGIVEYYGLNHFTQTPRNAVFEMNGQETKALSNRFVLNSSMEIRLSEVTDDAIPIGYKGDGTAALNKIGEVLNDWNQLMDRANRYAKESDSYPKLANELKAAIRRHGSEIESAGIIMDDGGLLSMDRALALQSFEEGDLKQLFSQDSGFIEKMNRTINRVSTDPMEYVDKKVVIYPNTRKQGFSYTYMTSMYSGMLFNYYC